MRPLFEIRETPGKGKGVFAVDRILAAQIVLKFEGKRTPVGEIEDFTHFLEFEEGVFLGPSGRADDYVNHSCDPNARVVVREGEYWLESISVIEPGDEISFDYSASMYDDPTDFDCDCGANSCRGRIRSIRVMSEDERKELVEKGLVSGFIMDRLSELSL